MSSEEYSERDAIAALREHVVEIDGEPRIEVDVDGRRHTVEIRQIYQFERDILDRLIGPRADTSVTGGAVPIKGQWIHGWLELQGEDYINNIWKNYQVFIKYIEARTSVIENISTYKRSPGTYDSMYRYLLLLEELDLLERYRTETMDEDEYDFPVPAEFRERTFIRLQENYQDNKDMWDNPYEALYPDGSKEDEPPAEEVDVEIEPEETEIPEELGGLGGGGEGQTDEDTDDGDSGPEEGGLGAFTRDREQDDEQSQPEEEPQAVDDTFNMPEDNASFEDFPQKEGIVRLVENSFPEALQRTFEEAPIDNPQIEPEDFGPGQIAVFGTWAVGEATPGQSALELVVSINDRGAAISPGFVPSGIEEHLPAAMRDKSPYRDIFPNFFVVSIYNSAFKRRVDEVVRREQSELVYYDLQSMELKEL